MSDTVRQRIVAAVETRWKTILTAKGYQTSVGAKVFVCRPTKPTDSEAAAGVLNIWDLVEDTKPKLSGIHEHRLEIKTAVMKTGTGADDWIRKVIADLARAVNMTTGGYEGRKWSGLATDTEPGRNEYELDQENKLTGTVIYPITIIYRTPSWDAFNVA